MRYILDWVRDIHVPALLYHVHPTLGMVGWLVATDNAATGKPSAGTSEKIFFWSKGLCLLYHIIVLVIPWNLFSVGGQSWF